MQPNALGFVRKSRVEGLIALKPSDGRFLAVQLSEDSVFPPTDEAVEEIAELRREAFTCYKDSLQRTRVCCGSAALPASPPRLVETARRGGARA